MSDNMNNSFIDDELEQDGNTSPIQLDFADPDFTENGRDYWEHYRFEVEKGQVLLRIDKYLVERIKGTSRNRIQNAADAQCIRVNGRPVKSNYRVHPDDVISVVMDRPRYENEIVAQDIPLNIVYEDDELLVVNKPAGMCVHPGHGNYDGTLVNALAWHFKDNPDYDVTDPRMGLVHRIDKDTSGLLVVAKTPRAKTALGLQFFNKTTKRQYIAVVWGEMKQDDGTVTGNIGRSLRDRLQMCVFPDGDMGKHAVTHYHTLENLAHVAVVRCQLETGRTHQIRVHMKHIGHPLFNDERYGGDQILRGNTSSKYAQFIHNCFALCPRQALHAKTLGFVHPATGQQMDFDSELPQDMECLIQKWRDYANALR
ncbi:MAG: RluA family pseudouridine synthase [Bacteroidales bacterium]|uniref:RluA family pseudouridine synthase n=1 Tax=Sodaliphilus sp. TaxID=2815818 RepID=UPI001B75871B|nr:RluA family pseudouridine synthase [Candidatus Sodaliphilus limicaballi]